MPSFRALILLALASPSASAGEVPFEREVMAVLSRAGCNAGACHGNLNGKGGLKLTLRGEGAAIDFTTLTRDMLARRVDRHRPDQSLILLKSTGQVPHEGGVRFAKSSPEYSILRTWIAAGCPPDPPNAPRLAKLEVTPSNKILVEPEDRFRIRATAHFATAPPEMSHRYPRSTSPHSASRRSTLTAK